jgi:hypothetical protein
MPDKHDTLKAGAAQQQSAKPAGPPEETAGAATEEEAAQQRPLPDRAELEQLRARLIAQYRGRR